MKLINSNDRIGIAHEKKQGKEIEIKGSRKVEKAVRSFSEYGLITFSREQYFKSTYFTIHFLKPVETLRNLYNLGNEVLILCSDNGMNEFKSRTKDFLDFLLITSDEYRNRLDKITCILIDASEDVIHMVKEDRIQNPDARLIVPFSFSELQNGIAEDELQNRFRDFLYERDLFGIASPLNSETLFFGKDRTNIISELFGKYKQGEQGGLFGLRRIGKTSILNLLQLRIERENGASIYFDCSQYHLYRWNEFLKEIIGKIREKYALKNTTEHILVKESNMDDSNHLYQDKNAMKSFEEDIKELYYSLGETRILLIFDEIESISYTTSPSEHWQKDKDSLFFWQAMRAIIQTDNRYFSFLIAGVNPKIIELGRIKEYDNPIFGMFKPIYMDLFDFDDVKKMTSSIGGHLGLKFEEEVYAKLIEDYGGHPFLTRQVCSRINSELLVKKALRPITITKYGYEKKAKEYKIDMLGVIEQILGVLQNYYPSEFNLLKKLALDGRKSFSMEISSGEKKIQHLCGYRLIDKDEGEYFIRIKSIEEYLRDKFIYDKTLDENSDKLARLNLRRDRLENRLRNIIFYSLAGKYGKKAKEKLLENIAGTTKDASQASKINAVNMKEAMGELYFWQYKQIIDKNWKDFQAIFIDKTKFDNFYDIVSNSRNISAHGKQIEEENEAMINIAFKYFEKCLQDYE